MTPQAEVILRDGNKTFTVEVAENAEKKTELQMNTNRSIPHIFVAIFFWGTGIFVTLLFLLVSSPLGGERTGFLAVTTAHLCLPLYSIPLFHLWLIGRNKRSSGAVEQSSPTK